MKIGRNAPCWCGSPKKFKKCHGASDEPFTLQQSAEHIARPFSVRMCLRPEGLADECKGQIVRAHTIQRGGGLSRIADKGKVFTFMPGSWTTFIANAGKLKVRRVGIKDASTFTGFCERHDAAVFAPLEQKPFVGSPQQAFLLLYRAVCHEAYKKRAHAEALHVVEDQARRMGSDPGRRLAFLGRMGAMAGGQDLARMKQRLDEILLAGSYDTEIDWVAPYRTSATATQQCPSWDLHSSQPTLLERPCLAG